MQPEDATRDTRLSELEVILGLRPAPPPPPAAPAVSPAKPAVPRSAPGMPAEAAAARCRQHPQLPAPPRSVRPGDPPTFRLLEPWELPGVALKPNDGSDDDDYEEDYDDDPDNDSSEEDTSAPGRVAARVPAGPPLGSYESRRAALSRPKRGGPLPFVLSGLVLVGIGFGAVKLFGMGTGAPLADQSGQRPPGTASPSPSAPVSSAAGTIALAGFAGYPGQRDRDGGQVAISSIAAGGGQTLAVGSADGYPAVWRRGTGSSWTLADAASKGVLGGRPGNQTLSAIANGPAGWVAVGGVVSGARQHPVVVTSSDGSSWRAADGSAAFAAPGLYTYGATAGQADDVVVGERVTGNTATPAAWWSTGSGAWSRGTAAGHSGQQSEMFSVTTGKARFIAAGADGGKAAVWTSPDGRKWTLRDLPLPAGTSKAALREVVSAGTHVVAVGNAATTAGASAAFAEVSSDDGATWHEVRLPSLGPQAIVTALTASGTGFVAAGQSGKPSAPVAVAWTSPDGTSWAPARKVPDLAGGKVPGGKVAGISALTAAGGKVTGVGLATTRSAETPVVYQAPAS